MKLILVIVASLIAVLVSEAKSLKPAKQELRRQKRQTLSLPDGVELLLNRPLDSGFRCQDSGYFADVANDCQVFHICNAVPPQEPAPNTEPVRRAKRQAGQGVQFQQYTFICGNQTVFNQLTLTCSHPDDAIPCESAPSFFYLNGNIGQTETPFLTDEDLDQGLQLITSVRRTRVNINANTDAELELNRRRRRAN